MLWTTLRWNWGNTLALAAFCLLPIIGIAEGGFSDTVSIAAAPSAELQHCGVKLSNVGVADQTGRDVVACA